MRFPLLAGYPCRTLEIRMELGQSFARSSTPVPSVKHNGAFLQAIQNVRVSPDVSVTDYINMRDLWLPKKSTLKFTGGRQRPNVLVRWGPERLLGVSEKSQC